MAFVYWHIGVVKVLKLVAYCLFVGALFCWKEDGQGGFK
jgi:hypothetical protein